MRSIVTVIGAVAATAVSTAPANAAVANASAIVPARSLVGATEFPPAQILSGETIQIEREFRGPGAQRLTFELRPDNSLRITISAADRKKEVSSETFLLSSEIAANARTRLRRVRPQEVGAGVAFPSNCATQSATRTPDVTVMFTSSTSSAPVDDSGRRIFALPPQSDCSSKEAIAARNVIAAVLNSFPASTLRSEYWHRKWRSEALGRPSWNMATGLLSPRSEQLLFSHGSRPPVK